MNTPMHKAPEAEPNYDYSNSGRPRDFDIRIEVAEQKEILQQSLQQPTDTRWHCSEYDF